jgi:SAM-dependent methyltransferase
MIEQSVTERLKYVVGETRCRLYDWRHRVQTCGDVSVDSLGDVGENVDSAAPYMPSHPKFLDSIIRNLRIDYRRYNFVDLGSGKGRVLLVASEFPFARVQGVEFSRSLHEIAVENVRRYSSRTQRCKNVEPIHGDAMEYEFPQAPTIIFMFNPFKPAVLVPVLRRLEASIRELPRDIVLLYTAPYHGDLVESETSLRLVSEERYHNQYRFTP